MDVKYEYERIVRTRFHFTEYEIRQALVAVSNRKWQPWMGTGSGTWRLEFCTTKAGAGGGTTEVDLVFEARVPEAPCP